MLIGLNASAISEVIDGFDRTYGVQNKRDMKCYKGNGRSDISVYQSVSIFEGQGI